VEYFLTNSDSALWSRMNFSSGVFLNKQVTEIYFLGEHYQGTRDFSLLQIVRAGCAPQPIEPRSISSGDKPVVTRSNLSFPSSVEPTNYCRWTSTPTYYTVMSSTGAKLPLPTFY